MVKKTKEALMRYLYSSLITFISAFCLFVGTELVTDTISSPEAVYALLAAAGMAGVRAVIKYLNERFVIG